MEQYEIQDDKGVIHSFTDKHEADKAWDFMIAPESELKKVYPDAWKQLHDKYHSAWTGGLKLVQIHRIYR